MSHHLAEAGLRKSKNKSSSHRHRPSLRSQLPHRLQRHSQALQHLKLLLSLVLHQRSLPNLTPHPLKDQRLTLNHKRRSQIQRHRQRQQSQQRQHSQQQQLHPLHHKSRSQQSLLNSLPASHQPLRHKDNPRPIALQRLKRHRCPRRVRVSSSICLKTALWTDLPSTWPSLVSHTSIRLNSSYA